MPRCKSCDAEILWVRGPSGKALAVDAAPSEDGGVAVMLGAGRLLRPGDAPLPGETRHHADHRTCSSAAATPARGPWS